MKSTKSIDWSRISASFKQYLKEAEDKEEDAPAEKEGEDNPFAATAGDEGGDEAPADDAPADDAEKEEGGDDKKKAPAEKPAGIPIKFNVSKVKKYNTANFLSDTGVVKSINKDGIVVTTQPDQVDVLVNFDDISESVKRFFKPKK